MSRRFILLVSAKLVMMVKFRVGLHHVYFVALWGNHQKMNEHMCSFKIKNTGPLGWI
eukprot:GDKH01011245.1.p1 GENE.GDKH01011245.1~~GDKH01011245.1.p1  ORF type:complete len:57 (-),score=1.70 GDKH01011245.1:48-218(-)